MIVRILGEGQLDVDDSLTAELNELDAKLEEAVNSGDEDAFRPVLTQMLDRCPRGGNTTAGGFVGTVGCHFAVFRRHHGGRAWAALGGWPDPGPLMGFRTWSRDFRGAFRVGSANLQVGRAHWRMDIQGKDDGAVGPAHGTTPRRLHVPSETVTSGVPHNGISARPLPDNENRMASIVKPVKCSAGLAS